MLEKTEWTNRFSVRLEELQPLQRCGNLTQIVETFWYYTRHRSPEEAAEARVAGLLPAQEPERAWINACSHGIRAHAPQLGEHETRSLAESLWHADPLRVVDPYVMADALCDQAILMSLDLNDISRAARLCGCPPSRV